jgi:ABC-2 type transport system ATP-binding protein
VDDGSRRLGYFASFRPKWNSETEHALLEQFRLDQRQKTSHLSKGQRTQALVIAICPEPELLMLDEPTSGLDPIVRREFIRTVIGAYQDGDHFCLPLKKNRRVVHAAHGGVLPV